MDVFRKEYAPLTDEQKTQMEAIKIKAQELLDLFQVLEERNERSRCTAIARTNLEQAVMWAVKGVTTKAE